MTASDLPKVDSVVESVTNATKRLSQISANTVNSKRKNQNHVGPWKLGRTLGRGSTGRVRLAKHAQTGQLAAVKIIPKSNIKTADGDGLPYGIEREIIIMKLISHPNIMGLFDVWENRGELYLVLEYIEGGELFDYLIKKGKLDEREAARYFRQIIDGVDYCHQFNICHRDLKPENLLLDKNRNIKIADFGMAALEISEKMLETSCGSPHYASPEIVAGRNYHGAPSDIWSCGIILFALLTGHLPFDDENIRKLLLKVQKGSFMMPKALSPEARDLIARMLRVNPVDRITIQGILRHPFMLKYPQRYLEQVAKPHFRLSSIQSVDQIDKEILKNLQILFHGAKPQFIVQKLLAPESNSEKVFYYLLMKYRNEHSTLVTSQEFQRAASSGSSVGSKLPRSVSVVKTTITDANGNTTTQVTREPASQRLTPSVSRHNITPSVSRHTTLEMPLGNITNTIQASHGALFRNHAAGKSPKRSARTPISASTSYKRNISFHHRQKSGSSIHSLKSGRSLRSIITNEERLPVSPVSQRSRKARGLSPARSHFPPLPRFPSNVLPSETPSPINPSDDYEGVDDEGIDDESIVDESYVVEHAQHIRLSTPTVLTNTHTATPDDFALMCQAIFSAHGEEDKENQSADTQKKIRQQTRLELENLQTIKESKERLRKEEEAELLRERELTRRRLEEDNRRLLQFHRPMWANDETEPIPERHEAKEVGYLRTKGETQEQKKVPPIQQRNISEPLAPSFSSSLDPRRTLSTQKKVSRDANSVLGKLGIQVAPASQNSLRIPPSPRVALPKSPQLNSLRFPPSVLSGSKTSSTRNLASYLQKDISVSQFNASNPEKVLVTKHVAPSRQLSARVMAKVVVSQTDDLVDDYADKASKTNLSSMSSKYIPNPRFSRFSFGNLLSEEYNETLESVQASTPKRAMEPRDIRRAHASMPEEDESLFDEAVQRSSAVEAPHEKREDVAQVEQSHDSEESQRYDHEQQYLDDTAQADTSEDYSQEFRISTYGVSYDEDTVYDDIKSEADVFEYPVVNSVSKINAYKKPRALSSASEQRHPSQKSPDVRGSLYAGNQECDIANSFLTVDVANQAFSPRDPALQEEVSLDDSIYDDNVEETAKGMERANTTVFSSNCDIGANGNMGVSTAKQLNYIILQDTGMEGHQTFDMLMDTPENDTSVKHDSRTSLASQELDEKKREPVRKSTEKSKRAPFHDYTAKPAEPLVKPPVQKDEGIKRKTSLFRKFNLNPSREAPKAPVASLMLTPPPAISAIRKSYNRDSVISNQTSVSGFSSKQPFMDNDQTPKQSWFSKLINNLTHAPNNGVPAGSKGNTVYSKMTQKAMSNCLRIALNVKEKQGTVANVKYSHDLKTIHGSIPARYARGRILKFRVEIFMVGGNASSATLFKVKGSSRVFKNLVENVKFILENEEEQVYSRR
ncbi:hypothetical protein BABINDRAFT_160052 [Babjeviella inositovora NRRL Y-12698]|uniref:non-specific serine/threonine protein kinase n=1 Tax=Babjeviella inositovora NRRL Y-12698 TaxID=984486 RepID=A0A1E3QW80_9ASCO|nr:uncharacterized protein BABINDRAFT_160052 [Babjeviella inositovora NRRL Y-12698]ODQ81814.1 hypothetical protein BABINDRAFT_160052 [Babjeviella inositovora NRRL Y-12698]